MNNLYFACRSCKVYVDAGYRWAYCTLEEEGLVKRGAAINVLKVLGAHEYWNPGQAEQSKWLCDEVLPSVRGFLQQHASHEIAFGEEEDFIDFESNWFLEWLREDNSREELPRFLFERMKLDSWDAVSRRMKQLEFAPTWWEKPDQRELVERWYKARLMSKQALSRE